MVEGQSQHSGWHPPPASIHLVVAYLLTFVDNLDPKSDARLAQNF